MKKIITLILVIGFAIAFAQESALDEANKLIENKKYISALAILNNADPANDNPEIAIAKTNLFLNYFITSIMHNMFALKDLEPGEELMELRGSEGKFDLFLFKADSILSRLIEKYPENYYLRKTLGYYYHEVYFKYQQRWLEPDSVIVEKFLENYKMAFDSGIFDYWSVYGIGYAYLIKADYVTSIKYFEKSTELKPDYPSSHYNLAYAYLYINQQEKGIVSAKTAMELYDYPEYKADAARMIATMYRELQDFENSIDYYKRADKIQADDYYTLKPLLELEVSNNKKNYPTRTNQFFLLDPDNPTIYQDLMEIYWNNEKIDELYKFLNAQHKNYLTNHKVNGNLYFYKAVIQYDKGDFQNSKINFEESREIFKKVFKEDHNVFNAIDSYVNEIK